MSSDGQPGSGPFLTPESHIVKTRWADPSWEPAWPADLGPDAQQMHKASARGANTAAGLALALSDPAPRPQYLLNGFQKIEECLKVAGPHLDRLRLALVRARRKANLPATFYFLGELCLTAHEGLAVFTWRVRNEISTFIKAELETAPSEPLDWCRAWSRLHARFSSLTFPDPSSLLKESELELEPLAVLSLAVATRTQGEALNPPLEADDALAANHIVPCAEAPSARPSVELRGEGSKPLVYGREKPPVDGVPYRALRALIGAFPRKLHTSELNAKAKAGDAVKALKDLCKEDPDGDWERAIYFPGLNARDGYGIQPLE